MSSLVFHIQTAVTTINEILADLGFEQVDSDAKTHIYMYRNTTNQQVRVIFSINPNNIRESIIEDVVENTFIYNESFKSTDVVIIVIQDEMNENMQETINQRLKNEWEEFGRLIVVMSLKKLQFNILKHEIVPKHTLMTEREVSEMHQQFNITDVSQLPEISRFDPVAMCLLMKPGDTCKIERSSKTAITTTYYRYCLNI